MSIRDWLVGSLFGDQISARVQAAVKVIDDEYWRQMTATNTPFYIPWWERRTTLERIYEACEQNPLAARLVGLTTDFVIGSGVECEGDAFALTFWSHPQNRLGQRVYRWCNDLTKTGELFLVLSRNPGDGMSYVREMPALMIDEIEVDAQDIEREYRYHQMTDDSEGRWWPSPLDAEAEQIMLHYSVNRGSGQNRGTSDLQQVLTWLERYDMWLEDRVRINRYKGAFLWQVQVANALPGQLEAKRAMYTKVPSSGSIIVSDENETWTAVQPQIGAASVEADGKALRLMIAAGAGVPLHFLAEGESATRATAMEMGTPTYRHFVHRQNAFKAIVEDVIMVAAERAGTQSDPKLEFESVLAEYRPNATPVEEKNEVV